MGESGCGWVWVGVCARVGGMGEMMSGWVSEWC